MSLIEIKELRKEYKIPKTGNKRKLFGKEYEIKHAVDGISFQVEEGEAIGYIGPNGAGKSTTIKMMSGILTPTSGEIEIAGLVPHKSRKKYAGKIGVVFGQRTQLWWELPVADSFQLLKSIYRVSDSIYEENMRLFNEILELDQFLNKPVRQLSLGQRVRADFAASLLHNPKLIFLDEPTIGLDVLAKEKIRTFIKEMNRSRNVTVIITSHDMDDIEQICRRTMIIDHGKLIYDGSIEQLKDTYQTRAVLTVKFEHLPALPIELPGCTLVSQEGKEVRLSFSKQKMSARLVLENLLKQYDIKDFQLQDASVEEIIKEIYRR